MAPLNTPLDFCDRILFKSMFKVDTFLLPMGRRAIFAFSEKTGLKSAKNVVFCILCIPVGGLSPPPP